MHSETTKPQNYTNSVGIHLNPNRIKFFSIHLRETTHLQYAFIYAWSIVFAKATLPINHKYMPLLKHEFRYAWRGHPSGQILFHIYSMYTAFFVYELDCA